MPANPQEKKPTAEEKQERRRLDDVIGRRVMHTLGHPGDLRGVHVRWLWEDRYRVNVVVGPDAACIKVAHSYFLVTDGEGNILASTPKITRQY
jgi:hypothetical protein